MFLIVCQKEAAFRYSFPGEVEPYVQDFVNEAKARGLEMKIDNLIVEFAQPDGDFIKAYSFVGKKLLPKHDRDWSFTNWGIAI